MLTANVVQKMLGVQDYDNVAYGYTFERRTVSIYFAEGQLVREDSDYLDKPIQTMVSDTFAPDFFRDGIKRFYVKKTKVELIQLFATFGNPLPLI